MANEAILRLRYSDPRDFTVADGTAITKGAICALTDPLTAILASSVAQPVAGIAARDKVASDGRTRLALYRSGWFDIISSGAIPIGGPVTTASTGSLNYVSGAAPGATGNAVSGAAIFGHTLETASDNERVLVCLTLE